MDAEGIPNDTKQVPSMEWHSIYIWHGISLHAQSSTLDYFKNTW